MNPPCGARGLSLLEVLETQSLEPLPPAGRRLTIYNEQSGSPETRSAQPLPGVSAGRIQGQRMTPKTTDLKPLSAIVKPEERELALKLEEQAGVEAELAERELKAETLRAELAAFERQYLHHVGSLYAELDDLKAQIAAQKAAATPADETAKKAAEEARSRAEETKACAGEKSEVAPASFEATPEMKRLYREVAKRIHPDLASEAADRSRRQILMAEVNQAYESGDEARLTKILTGYECSPEAVKGDGAGADLIRVIRRISQARARVIEIDSEVEILLGSDLYRLKSRLDEAQAVGRDVLSEMAAKVAGQIARAKSQMENAPLPASQP
jgi:hypothetical protein